MLTGISRNSILILCLRILIRCGRTEDWRTEIAGGECPLFKPVMGANPEGQICQLGQGKRHEESSGEDGRTDRRRCDQSDGKILAISLICNCPERAMAVES